MMNILLNLISILVYVYSIDMHYSVRRLYTKKRYRNEFLRRIYANHNFLHEISFSNLTNLMAKSRLSDG